MIGVMRTMAAAMLVSGVAGSALAAQYMEKNELQKKFAFSPAVITQGGRVVFLSGQTALMDTAGTDIGGQFDPQVRTIFRLIDTMLRKTGGSLSDVTTMTIYVTDARYLERFAELRRETWKGDDYPASTFVAVAALPFSGALIEIQATAVIDDFCSKTAPCSPR